MTIISHSLKLIFIHIPKTAGTTIRTLLLKNDPDAISDVHLTYIEIKEKYFKEKNIDEYNIFSVVRNSYDISVSLYCYFIKDKGYIIDTVNKDILTFSEFIKNSTTSQLRWLSLENGTYIKNILRYEELNLDFKYFLYNNNIKLEYDDIDSIEFSGWIDESTSKHKGRNVSNNIHYSKFYTNDDYEFITAVYKEDIDYFKFKFSNE
jgi:hypothetical protein